MGKESEGIQNDFQKFFSGKGLKKSRVFDHQGEGRGTSSVYIAVNKSPPSAHLAHPALAASGDNYNVSHPQFGGGSQTHP